MKEIKFSSKLDFLKSFLKDPKKMASSLAVGTTIFAGGQRLSAQELSGTRDYSTTPNVEDVGHSVHSDTFMIQNIDKNSLDFLMQNFEYRYGRDITNKLFSEKYNIGLEVGSNNYIIGNKPISKKAYEQFILATQLSKVLKLPVDIKLGYNQKLNYVGVFTQKGKKIPDFNLGLYLKPNANGSFYMYAEAGITKGKVSGFLRLSKGIGQKSSSKAAITSEKNKASTFVSREGLKKQKSFFT